VATGSFQPKRGINPLITPQIRLFFKPNTIVPWWLQHKSYFSRNVEIFKKYLFERTNSCEEK
jgi:hypothetical protein